MRGGSRKVKETSEKSLDFWDGCYVHVIEPPADDEEEEEEDEQKGKYK